MALSRQLVCRIFIINFLSNATQVPHPIVKIKAKDISYPYIKSSTFIFIKIMS